MAGLLAERQERGLIDAINSGYGQNNAQPFTLIGANGVKITNEIGRAHV